MIQYFLKNQLLNPRYKISVELKIIDEFYYILTVYNYKNIKFFFIIKFARYADFSIFLVILMIQLLYNILDFINLDPVKNDFNIHKDYMSKPYNLNLFFHTRN